MQKLTWQSCNKDKAEAPQIKDLKLIIRNNYLFMADNTIFYAFGIQGNYLEKTKRISSTLPLGSYKTSLDASPPPKILSLHYKQINKVKNELDGQPSSLLASMHIFNCNLSFSQADLVFLELEKMHQHHLDFKILDENNKNILSPAIK